MNILALDVGTSSVKAAVLDVAGGKPVGIVAKADYDLDRPTADAAEVPADRLWQAVAAAARQATADCGDVQGVGLSVLSPVLILLDKKDQPLGSIWTHLDRRSRPAARQVWQEVGAEFLAEIGNRPLPGGITAVCYRQRLSEDPSLRQRVRSYLHANGWLALRLTGERAFDPANASFSGLFGTLTDHKWSRRWCEYFQVEPDWLPSVVCGSTTVGSLRSAAAAELGLPAGLPVKLGTADTSTAILAAGMSQADLLHVVGTTQVLAGLTDRPRPDPKRLTRLLGIGKAFLHVTHNPVGGTALDWLHQLCFREQTADEFFEATIPRALERHAAVVLDPPFLGGDRLEIDPARAGLREITLATDRLDVLAAVLQAMREHHYRALESLGLSGPFQRIFLTGGGAEVVRRLIPEYGSQTVHQLDDGSLRGVARLFASE